MKQDTIRYDSLKARPLPKWLTDQREGLNYYQPEMPEMKEDHSLKISMMATGVTIILIVAFLTVYIIFRNRKRRSNESV